MAARLTTSQLARALPSTCRTVLNKQHTVRCLTSTSWRAAAPKKVGGKPLWGKKKGTGEEDSAAGGQGLGNVLDEVTLPAPDLSSLQTLQPENLTPKAVGEVMAFSEASLATFKALGLPPLLEKEFAYSRRPATVVRGSTLQAAKLLDGAKQGASKQSRSILTGSAGSGKSVLLLQTLAHAQATGWITLYLPSATPTINSSTPHVYSSTSALFEQPTLALSLLSKFAKANAKAFKGLKTSQEWKFGERTVVKGTTLEALATKGVDEKSAQGVLEALLEELAAQSSHPVLLGIDDAQGLFATSSYVDPTYQPVESFSLTVPRLLLEYISGAKSLNKGAILLSPSSLSTRQSPALRRFLDPSPSSGQDAYAALGTSFDTYAAILQGVGKIQVPARLEREEAVGVVRMLQGWRGVREIVSDQSFLERYVATDGSPRHFRKALERSVEV